MCSSCSVSLLCTPLFVLVRLPGGPLLIFKLIFLPYFTVHFTSHFTSYFTSYFPISLLVSVSYFDLCRGVVVAILLIDKTLVELLSEVDLYSINSFWLSLASYSYSNCLACLVFAILARKNSTLPIIIISYKGVYGVLGTWP